MTGNLAVPSQRVSVCFWWCFWVFLVFLGGAGYLDPLGLTANTRLTPLQQPSSNTNSNNQEFHRTRTHIHKVPLLVEEYPEGSARGGGAGVGGGVQGGVSPSPGVLKMLQVFS